MGLSFSLSFYPKISPSLSLYIVIFLFVLFSVFSPPSVCVCLCFHSLLGPTFECHFSPRNAFTFPKNNQNMWRISRHSPVWPIHIQGVALKVDPKYDADGLFFECLILSAVLKGKRPQNRPFLRATPPPKLQPEWNSTTCSKILGQDQNISDKKRHLAKTI